MRHLIIPNLKIVDFCTYSLNRECTYWFVPVSPIIAIFDCLFRLKYPCPLSLHSRLRLQFYTGGVHNGVSTVNKENKNLHFLPKDPKNNLGGQDHHWGLHLFHTYVQLKISLGYGGVVVRMRALNKVKMYLLIICQKCLCGQDHL